MSQRQQFLTLNVTKIEMPLLTETVNNVIFVILLRTKVSTKYPFIPLQLWAIIISKPSANFNCTFKLLNLYIYIYMSIFEV